MLKRKKIFLSSAGLRTFLKQKRDGFSYVELVIVTSLIAILVVVLLPLGNHFYIKAKDTKRITDLDSLKRVLSLYKLEHNEKVPQIDLSATWKNLQTELKSYFTTNFPKDPRNDFYFNYIYCSDKDSRKYLLYTRLERDSNNQGLKGKISYSLEDCVSSSSEISRLVPFCDGLKNYCIGNL